MTFVSTDPQNHQGDNTWFTPKEILEGLGDFDLDVCSTKDRPFDIAKKHLCLDEGVDSLHKKWEGRVWMNPPYGKEIEPFIKKFLSHGDGIGLVFARMGTSWMQEYLKFGDGVYFLRKRIGFLDRMGNKKSNAGADSCLLIQGKHNFKYLTSLEGTLVELQTGVEFL